MNEKSDAVTAIIVELVAPDGVSHTYINMSHIPRVGDTVLLIDGDNDLGNCVVSGVKWLIDLNNSANQSDCVVVTLARKD